MNTILIILGLILLLLLIFAAIAYFLVYKPIVKMNILGSELYKDFFGNIDDKGL